MRHTRRDFAVMAAGLAVAQPAPAQARQTPRPRAVRKPWSAAAIQGPMPQIKPKTPADVIGIVRGQLAVLERQIDLVGTPDLVVTPEFFITGGRAPGNIDVVAFPGPEVELVQALAAKRRVFIATNAYTRDAMFPDRYMNTSFIIDRTGNVVLKAYRLHSNHSHSPHDFLDEFLQQFGVEGLFPVADTELGKLSTVTAMELNYPEVSRALVLRGAEVLLHISSDGVVDRSVKRARAIENEACVVSANAAGRKGIHPSMDVGSCVIDWRGEVLAQLPQGAEGRCVGSVDVAAVRAKRGDMDLEYKGQGPNYLARMRVELFRDVYGKSTIFPPNRYGKGFPVNQTVDMQPQADLFAEARENMARMGINVT